MLAMGWAIIVASAIGQTPTATVSGRVVDGIGVVLPGVSISAKSGEQQTEVTAVGDGTFAFVDLRPGSYILTATLSGFRMQQKRIDVKAGETKTVDFTMRVGCLPGSITVSDDRPRVDSRLPARSDLVAHLRIDERMEEDHPSDPECRTRYRATVLRAVQRSSFGGSVGRTIEVVLNSYPDIELGHEYVVWLAWRADKNAFDSGPSLQDVVGAVEDGRVNSGLGPCVNIQDPPPNYCPQKYSVEELFTMYEQAFR
jgi:hypothetical protein